MHLRHNMDTKYYITQDNQKWVILSVQQEKDLGVLISSDLDVSYQCIEVASKPRRVLGMVRRQFKKLDIQSFLIIYTIDIPVYTVSQKKNKALQYCP